MIAALAEPGPSRMALALTVNGRAVRVAAEPRSHLGDVLRDGLDLTGTHLGCEHGVCGACTVHVEGQPTRSCVMPVSAVGTRAVATIESLSADPVGARVQRAWRELNVPQCGYCQSGQVMAATALLKETPKPTDDDIAGAMTNLCRCGTYNTIAAAVRQASV